MVFGVLIFLNAATDQIRRASGHNWPSLRADLLRMVTFRQLRLRVLVTYLILPILFMFLEVRLLHPTSYILHPTSYMLL